jgi:hypothetical protein
MQTLTLQQLFGESASQSATELVIKKADLVAVGLTPQLNNRAEQLIVAIVLKSLENFIGVITMEDGISITDDEGENIDYDQGDRLYEFMQFLSWEPYFERRNALISVVRKTVIIHSFENYEIESFE